MQVCFGIKVVTELQPINLFIAPFKNGQTIKPLQLREDRVFHCLTTNISTIACYRKKIFDLKTVAVSLHVFVLSIEINVILSIVGWSAPKLQG